LKKFLKKIGIKQNIVIYSILLIISAIVIISYKNKYLDETNFCEGITIEAFGMLFDILVLGILFNIFNNIGERKREIRRYLEEIDDYRGWDEKEAMYRIVGNIKRLQKLGEKKLYLKNCYLEDAKLHGIELPGANLEGANLTKAKLQLADLQKANLKRANLTEAKLNWANLQGVDLFGAILQNASLEEANFEGASLTLANLENVVLTGAQGLTIDMLLKVISLYEVKGLEPKLEEEIKRKKPELFNSLDSRIRYKNSGKSKSGNKKGRGET
jgi:hypothetical protein